MSNSVRARMRWRTHALAGGAAACMAGELLNLSCKPGSVDRMLTCHVPLTSAWQADTACCYSHGCNNYRAGSSNFCFGALAAEHMLANADNKLQQARTEQLRGTERGTSTPSACLSYRFDNAFLIFEGENHLLPETRAVRAWNKSSKACFCTC